MRGATWRTGSERRCLTVAAPDGAGALALVSLLVVLSACQFSENRYLSRQVRSAELVGTWRATEFAINSLRDIVFGNT
jgi:hypothetical protein